MSTEEDGDGPAEMLVFRELRVLLVSRLAYHLACLREDATDPARSSLERLALVRDRAGRIREIRNEMEAYGVRTL